MTRAIHQLVANFESGDAISNEAVALRGIFHSWGCESEIFSELRRIRPELRGAAKDIAAYKTAARPGDVAILHLSIGSAVNNIFAELPCRKVIIYHNITPPEYFQGIQEQIARSLARGREQAKRLAGAAELVLAVSRFNASELEQMGYKDVRVFPLVLDLARLRESPGRSLAKRYADGMVNVLFVGRCVPNKRIEDCLAAFHYFQKYVEPNSRFIHAGSFTGMEQYHAMLLTIDRDMELKNTHLLGAVRQNELNAMYKSAHIFLSMSEHEGFCIPLIESMVHDLPILAYDAAAVPETLDGAGILFREKRFDLVAEMMGRLAKDQSLRAAVIKGQRERLARYEERDLAGELKKHLEPILQNG